MLDAALGHVRERRMLEAQAFLDRAAARIESEGLPPDDPLRGERDALAGHLLRLRGEVGPANLAMRDLHARALAYGWAGVAAQAAIQLGWISRSTDGSAASEVWMREAVRWAERADDAELIVQANCSLADVLSMNGDRAGSERAVEVAARLVSSVEGRFRVDLSRATLAERHGRPDEADRALRSAARNAPGGVAAYEVAFQRAKIALGRGDPEAALRHGRRAVKLCEGWGSRLVQGGARMLVGEIYRALGRLDEADRAYLASETLYGTVLSGRLASLNRGQVAFARGDYATAAAIVEPLIPSFHGNPIATSAAELCLVPTCTDRARLESLVGEAVGRTTASGVVHSDLARLAAGAAAVLAEREDAPEVLGLATRLAALAHDQWRRLGNPSEVGRTAEQLRGLRERGAPIPMRGFLLQRVIGEGASGTVWRGLHATSGEPVAIKVLRGGPSITATVRGMFARELRAVAGLDHPNVVWLLDHGWVDEAAATLDPRLEVDAPYLALEYAPHGTLDSRCGTLPWSEILPLLLEILDALAHAHARGLLHLDLKPTNVLMAGTAEQPVPKLADFGLARAPAPGRQLRATGTPAYMAPEQFGQDAGLLGPWSDLYAFGCLITALVSGAPPFGVRGTAALRDSHLNHRPPTLVPSMPVPTGLFPIVGRLLEKAPSERYRSAADVARALAQLGPADSESGIRPAVRPRRAGTTILMPVVELDLEAPTDAERPATPPVVPDRWDERLVPRPVGLLAAGLGLVSLRRPPTMGRAPERTELWNQLRGVATRGTGSALILTGTPGAGARHLARWLAERGHELGAARGLMVAPEHGLPEVLQGTDEGAIALELERLSGFRPMVVGLLRADQIPGSVRVLRAAERIEAPVLVVATCDGEAVEEVLRRLGRPAPVLRIGPLGLEPLRQLVTRLLPLTPDLADPICERAEGSPGAVIRMVRRLAEDRQLVPAIDGWRLRESADLDAVLVGPERSTESIALLRPADRTALRLLLSHGGVAPVLAWEEDCRGAGIPDPGATLERLSRYGWVDPEGPTVRIAEGAAEALARDPLPRTLAAG
ncbi:MAG: protein kinase [Myxococcota bacterium]